MKISGTERGRTHPTGGRHLGHDCRLRGNGAGPMRCGRSWIGGLRTIAHPDSGTDGAVKRRLGNQNDPAVIFKPAAVVEMLQAHD